MSGELKFRAWDKVGKKWVDFTLDDLSVDMSGGYAIEVDGSYLSDLENTRRFTGLKDRNSAEIFEGDVIELQQGHKLERSEVIFCADEGAFAVDYKLDERGYQGTPPTFLLKDAIEDGWMVIGNRYDGKALL